MDVMADDVDRKDGAALWFEKDVLGEADEEDDAIDVEKGCFTWWEDACMTAAIVAKRPSSQ